jgi:hypothetical protein
VKGGPEQLKPAFGWGENQYSALIRLPKFAIERLLVNRSACLPDLTG